MAGDVVEPLCADPLLHLHSLGEGPCVEVRARVQHLVRGIEKDAALALAGRDDTPDLRAGRQRADRRPRAARERAPEGPGIEVEAAHERHARVREQPVAERLLRRR